MDGLKDRLNDLLGRHTTATVATCGTTGPWAAAVFYVHDESLSLYFLTDPATRHGSELIESGRAAVTIHQDGQDWRTIQGVQMVGKAELVTGTVATARAWRLYLVKFPFVAQFLKTPGQFLDAYASAMGKVQFFRIRPEQAWVTDNGRRFGKRDVLEFPRSEQ